MAKNLQSLVQRAAINAGARATGLESKGFNVMVSHPAGLLSLPRHPMSGSYPIMPFDTEPRDVVVSTVTVERAGRSVGRAGVLAETGFAKPAKRTATQRFRLHETTLAGGRWQRGCFATFAAGLPGPVGPKA
jgi:hypothetical protein